SLDRFLSTFPTRRSSDLSAGHGLDLGAIGKYFLERDEPFLGQKQNDLFKDVLENGLELFASKTRNGVMVCNLLGGQPHKVDVLAHRLFYLSAGIGVVHIGIDHYLEHHFWMVTWFSLFAVFIYK